MYAMARVEPYTDSPHWTANVLIFFRPMSEWCTSSPRSHWLNPCKCIPLHPIVLPLKILKLTPPLHIQQENSSLASTSISSVDYGMLSMNDPSLTDRCAQLSGMLPFDGIGLYEQPKPRFIFKMPRVVPDQKAKFESDELFRRLSRESEVRRIAVPLLMRQDNVGGGRERGGGI